MLPVIPFIFAKSGEPFVRSGLPLLMGLRLSFTLVASLSVVGASWIAQANQWGRQIALIFFSLIGLNLMSPRFTTWLTLPLVGLVGRLQQKIGRKTGVLASLLVGASIGLLWAPCAGPILGLVLASATLTGSQQKTILLLLVFTTGAATSLGVERYVLGIEFLCR